MNQDEIIYTPPPHPNADPMWAVEPRDYDGIRLWIAWLLLLSMLGTLVLAYVVQ